MSDLLAHLRRELHELQTLAADERRHGFIEWAVHHENDAAVVKQQIADVETELEGAAA